MLLVWPSRDYLPSYVAALERGWSPDNLRGAAAAVGHIGYAVVPWKRQRGYATLALREVLLDARAEGLRYVEITTRPANLSSQRVITANGGVLIEEFVTPESVGGHIEMRYRVHLR